MKILFIGVLMASAAVLAADFGVIATSGVAEKSIEPNMVVVRMEIFGKGNTAKVAQQKQAAEFQRVKSAVEKFKVKKEDFQTENMNIDQEYNYDQKTRTNKIVGYKVNHSVKIILRKKEDMGPFVDAATSQAKADESSGLLIQSIQWDNDNKNNLTNALIAEAVADAKSKAESLARAAGVKLKGVHLLTYASPEINYPRSPYNRGMEVAMMKSSVADTGTEVAGGSIKIRAQVQAQYRID